MALSNFSEMQLETIRFHLSNYLDDDVDDALGELSLSQRKALLGNIQLSLEADKVSIEGEGVATRTSILGKLLLAYEKLSPEVVDDSLLVRSVGKVTLRRDELKARQRLYKSWQQELARFLGFSTGSASRRLGYASR